MWWSYEHPCEKDAVPAPLTGKREPNSQSIWNTWLLWEYWAAHPRLIQGQSLSLALETTFSKYISQQNNGLYFHFCLCYWERIENHGLIHDHYLYVSIKSDKMLIVRNAAEMPVLAFRAGDIHLPYLFICGLPVILLPPSDSKLYQQLTSECSSFLLKMSSSKKWKPMEIAVKMCSFQFTQLLGTF